MEHELALNAELMIPSMRAMRDHYQLLPWRKSRITASIEGIAMAYKLWPMASNFVAAALTGSTRLVVGVELFAIDFFTVDSREHWSIRP
jgi:hypothetical protein